MFGKNIHIYLQINCVELKKCLKKKNEKNIIIIYFIQLTNVKTIHNNILYYIVKIK